MIGTGTLGRTKMAGIVEVRSSADMHIKESATRTCNLGVGLKKCTHRNLLGAVWGGAEVAVIWVISVTILWKVSVVIRG